MFVRIFDDINGLIHLSEVSKKGTSRQVAESMKIGQVVQAKIILLDLKNRKIGLSIKAMTPMTDEERQAEKEAIEARREAGMARRAAKEAEEKAAQAAA